MKETKFYELCDKTGEINENITGGYFPTVEEMKNMGVDKTPEKYIHIISYFASNPFKRQNNSLRNLRDYEETVRYCKDLLCKIELQ